MNQYPDLELALRADFRARADPASTDAQFDAILDRAAVTPQRPGWLVRLRSPWAVVQGRSRGLAGSRTAWMFTAVALAAALVLAVGYFGGPLPAPLPPTASPSLPAATPSFSQARRNGKIFFARYESVLTLYTIDPDGTHLTKLFTSWGEGGVFAADGEHIVSPQAVFGSDGRDITVLDAPRAPLALSVLDMSPDGSRYLATGLLRAVGSAGGTPEAAEFGIYSVRAADFGDVRKLVSLGAWGSWPARFSPDGTMVAFILPNAAGDAGQLRLIGADGTGDRPLGSIANPGSLDWSPDGSSILVSSDAGVFVVDVATGAATEIVPQVGGPVVSPVWSPDGTRILFKQRVASLSLFDLLTMDASGGDVQNVTRGGSNIWFFDWGSHPPG